MRFKKVLLINPSYGGVYSAVLPAGLGYIAEALAEIAVEYQVLDMELGYDEVAVFQKIKEFQPDLIGFSMITYGYKRVFKLIRQIKERTNAKIALGGPFASTLRENVLIECCDVDFGLVMEGEETIKELCLGKAFGEIKGLVHKRDGLAIYNGDRPFIANLDLTPFPKYSGFELNKYPTDVINIVSSRGCPYACIYCPVNLVVGSKLRFRSAASVVAEIEYWYRKGFRRFAFADDNFTFMPERVQAICDEIDKRGLAGLHLILGNGIRADKVDRALLLRMKAVGLKNIGLGVETGSPKVLKKMKKAETLEQIEGAIGLCCELGFEVKLHFVLGAPGETLDDVKLSIDLALKYPVAEASFNNLIPYPGTEIYEWISKNNYFIKSPAEYLNDVSPAARIPVFFTPELSVRERLLAFRWADEAERKIRQRFYESKLRYGLLGKLMARTLSQKIIYGALTSNRSIKKYALKIRSLVLR